MKDDEHLECPRPLLPHMLGVDKADISTVSVGSERDDVGQKRAAARCEAAAGKLSALRGRSEAPNE